MKRNLAVIAAGAAILAVVGTGVVFAAFDATNFYVSNTLGVGTDAPAQKFHLTQGTAASTRFRLQNSEGSADFATDNGAFLVYTGGTPRLIVWGDGHATLGQFDGGNDFQVFGTTTTNVLEILGGSDLSENFNVTATDATMDVQPGMVVSIDPTSSGNLTISTEAYDPKVAGIVSGAGDVKTGMIMGQKGSLADGDHPVALTGRVYCLVDGTQEGVMPGDLLTTSATPGHAMKVQDHSLAQGAIIGKAMTSLRQGEKGLVLVLVDLQ